MAAVLTEAFEAAVVTDVNTHVTSGSFTGALYGTSMVLFTNSITPTSQTKYADLTQPSYTGYAAQALTFGAGFRRQEGGIATNSGLLSWSFSSGTAPAPIQGYGIVDGSTPPKLMMVENFPGGPISLIDTLSAFQVSAQFAMGGPDNGSCTVVD